MEIFRGYVSFGLHIAHDGLPRIPTIRERFIQTFQPGARNVYYEESGTRSAERLEVLRQTYQNQPLEERSIVLACKLDGAKNLDKLKAELTKYRSSLDRFGAARTYNATMQRDPSLEMWALFGYALWEMVDELPRDLAVEYDAEAFSSQDLGRNNFLLDQWNNTEGAIEGVIKAGNVSYGLGLARRLASELGESLRFRNPRVADKWNKYRDQAIQQSIPTRISSVFGLAHVGIENGLPTDEWEFEEDFDPALNPVWALAIACESDPKKVLTEDEAYSILLRQAVGVRFKNWDITLIDSLLFLQKLLERSTSGEIKQLIKSLPKGFNERFDGFAAERGLILPG